MYDVKLYVRYERIGTHEFTTTVPANSRGEAVEKAVYQAASWDNVVEEWTAVKVEEIQ